MSQKQGPQSELRRGGLARLSSRRSGRCARVPPQSSGVRRRLATAFRARDLAGGFALRAPVRAVLAALACAQCPWQSPSVELRLVLFNSVSVLEGFHGKLPQRAPGSHCTAAAACARGSPGKFLRELQEFVT